MKIGWDYPIISFCQNDGVLFFFFYSSFFWEKIISSYKKCFVFVHGMKRRFWVYDMKRDMLLDIRNNCVYIPENGA